MKIAKDENGDWIYPGDAAVLKALGETVQQLREEAGLTREQAAARMKAVDREIDKEAIRRSCALAIKNAREKAGMDRRTLSKKSGVPLRTIILIERGQVTLGFLEMVRIAFALKILPHDLTAEQERIEKNLREGKKQK
jgi:DNA-binding XRE family transcriptional regulator